MKFLVVGAGAREHALVLALTETKQKGDEFFCAPGNAGIESGGLAKLVPIASTDIVGLATWAKEHDIDLTIVGPEVPLALGIVDHFQNKGLSILGPNQHAAQLESSKAFAKTFMKKHKIKTASYEVFNEEDYASARLYVRQQSHPIVIKADGLAAGKGVVVSDSIKQSEDTLKDYFHAHTLGSAAHQVVIESFLPGEEASLIAIVDVGPDHVGYVAFPFCQDHKRVGEGDTGPNTGGMGAYAPVPHLQKYYDAAIKEVLDVSLGALSKEGQTYRGFIFCGLMISPEGNINVLEYNVRLGDPETCVLLPLASDVGLDIRDILIKAASGKLKEKILVKPKSFALGTVLASKGYPDAPKPVFGFTLVSDKNAWWCHAGTMLMENKTYQHKGGRVACAVSLADSLKTAQAQSLALVKQNVTTDMIYRSDIGYRAIDSMKK